MVEIKSCKGQERQDEIVERFAVQLVVLNPACPVKANHEKADAPSPIHVYGREYVPDITRLDGCTKHIYEVRTAMSLGEVQCLKRLKAIDDYARERRDVVMHLVVPAAGEQRAQGLVRELSLDTCLAVAAY